MDSIFLTKDLTLFVFSAYADLRNAQNGYDTQVPPTWQNMQCLNEHNIQIWTELFETLP